jgi:glucose/mannose-6-phosphate isomerase
MVGCESASDMLVCILPKGLRTFRSPTPNPRGMPTILDSEKAISSYDARDMLGAVERFPESMVSQLHYSASTGRRPKLPSTVRNIVFLGMGGSASAGDLVLDWHANKINIPAVVHRDPVLPRFVGANTLVVALSYSGDTHETLAGFQQARKRGSSLVAMGTGGKLQKLSEDLEIPFLQVLKAPAPRAALGQMVVATSIMLHNLGLIRNPSVEVDLASKELRRLINRVRRQVRSSENPAKQLALSLKGRLPIIYALQRMASVARRFKNQLAENSKMVAKYGILPEAGHNEVEAWLKPQFPLAPIFVRDYFESKFERAVLTSFRSTITKASRASSSQVRLKGGSRLAGLLLPVLYLDFVSVYLAFLNGIDPTDTPRIRVYKNYLS